MPSSSPTAANIWVLLGLGVAGIILMARKLKKAVRKTWKRAFVERLQLLPPPQPPPPKATHPLTGLSFAVAGVFDIAGYVTGFGNPDWARTHEAVVRTARAVSAVVEGGATCIGKTVVSEMAFGINGENKHYGTPINPAAHPRVPGGSCSGSAVAVAAGFVDFSLGKLLRNVKAFLRRGTAREMLGYYKEAIEDFGYALVLEPTNKTAYLAVNRLRKLFQ